MTKRTKLKKHSVKKTQGLSQERQTMFHVFDAMSDGVCIINKRCEFEYINPSLLNEFGPVQKQKCAEYFSDEPTLCPWCKNEKVLAGKTIHWEWYSPKNNKTYDVIDAPFLSPDGRMTKLEILHDISEQKKQQQEIQEQLDRTSQHLSSEMIERKKAQDEILTTKDYLQNIIDSAPEVIISFDTKNRVLTWNKNAEQLTGYSSKEVLNRPANKLQVFTAATNILSLLKDNCEGYTTEDIVIITKNNTKKILRISGSPIRTHEAVCIGSLFVGRDITRDIETHGKVLVGNTYLVPSESTETITLLYSDLVTMGYQGYYLTRSHFEPEVPLTTIASSHVILFSREKIPGYQTLSSTDDLIAFVKEIAMKNTNALIILDGIHYFLTQFSFPVCINALYQINDLIRNKNIIVILRIHPATVDMSQMGMLESEFQLLPSQRLEGLILEDVLIRILRFIYEQNTNNAIVSVNMIMAHFKIVYLTATKKIAQLADKDLIFTKRQGKLKTVYISEKGKSLLMKLSTG